MPDTPAALNKWFQSLRPEKRLELYFERIEMIMAIRKQLSAT